MSDYSWVPVFKAVSDWISEYEYRQHELVRILKEIGVDKGLDDELEEV